MKIRKLYLRDFRGIRELDLDLTHPGTGEALDLLVFAGRNGCGKTTLLEALIICLDRNDLLQDRAISPANVRRSTGGFFLKAEIQDSSGSRTVELQSDPIGNFSLTPRLRPFGVAYFSSWRTPRLVGPVAITAGKRGRKPRARV